MANELSLSGLTIAFSKTAMPTVNFTAATITPTVSGTQIMDNIQSVGTSEQAVLLGDVATGGYWFVQNMDPTNFVSIRQATGGTNFIKLLAGEWAIFRVSASSAAPYVIADTATCNVRFLRFDL